MTTEQSAPDTENSDRPAWLTPSRCFIGSSISGTLTFACYLLTKAIIITYSTKQITGNSALAVRIASAVRTLMMGMASLGTFYFCDRDPRFIGPGPATIDSR